ncbi:uncharacterized protein [Centruroides vittatus]|uniref:uncharacterized protein n=1 Tax=Centruroides vittatus TaxID=120091 RepID=UPI00350F2D49
MNDNTYGLSIEIDQHSDANVHFLDVDIRIDSHSIHTSVYRKQCASHTYIPSDSCDPIQYKIAAFRSLVRRAYTHSSTQQALRKELNHIEKIADTHGYRNIILRMSERQKIRMSQNTPTMAQGNNQSTEVERIPITYNPTLKSIYESIARRRKVTVAYRRGPTIYSLLRNGKDPSDPNRMAGVYRILIKDKRFNRNLIYIGSTKRSMEVRVKEHKVDIRYNRATTSLAVYASEPGINVDFTGAKLITKTTQIEHLKWLEAIEIHKAQSATTCINSHDEIALSLAWQALLQEDA